MINIAIQVFNVLTGTALGLALFVLSITAIFGGIVTGAVNFIRRRI